MHNFAVFGIPIIVFHVYVVVVVAAVVVNDTILDRLDKILMHLSMFSPRGDGGAGIRGRCGAFDKTCPTESGNLTGKFVPMVGRFECAE